MKGFTLIELLVVITIIAILSIVGIVVYTSTLKSARIAKRIEDLRAIKNALEVYYSVNKNYPSTFVVGATPFFKSSCTTTDVIPNLVPKYMNSFPTDPAIDKENNKNCYYYTSDGIDYKVRAQIESSEMTQDNYKSQPSLIDPKKDGDVGGSACLVDGSNITAWAIWSSCDPTKCAESSCSW